MKKLIEYIKDTFRRDELPQDISNHLESTRDIYDFIREDQKGKSYIPIPKELYNKGTMKIINKMDTGLDYICKKYNSRKITEFSMKLSNNKVHDKRNVIRQTHLKLVLGENDVNSTIQRTGNIPESKAGKRL